ncbi:MAG: hypothetical protein AAF138_05290 [Planctomycetota bacterium]
MSTEAQTSAAPRSGRGRRWLSGLSALLALLAATACALVLTLVAERAGSRHDVTATAAHRLAPRTERLLTDINADPTAAYEVVISADFERTAPWVRAQLAEILDRIDSASDRLDVTVIDLAGVEGARAMDDLRSRLAERERPLLEEHNHTIGEAAGALSDLPATLDALSVRVDELAGALGPTDPIADTVAQWARALRTQSSAIAQAESRVRTLRASLEAGDLSVLQNTSRIARRALLAVTSDLASIARGLDAIAQGSRFDPAARDLARSLAPALTGRRERLAAQADALDRLRTPDAVRVDRVLRSGEAAIVTGPRGVTAVDLDALLNPTAVADAVGAGRVDVRQRAEALLAGAIDAVRRDDHPIVVLMHGEAARFVGDADVFTLLLARLALRGIDVVEWATVLDENAPPLESLDPSATRPVVYAVLGTDAGASSPALDERAETTGVERTNALASAVRRVLDRGEPVLLSLIPSPLPSFGEDDPQARVVKSLGLSARTGAPLLRERVAPSSPTGRVVDPAIVARAEPGPHPLLAAIAGLPTRLDWPVPLTIEPGAQATPLLEVAGDRSLWAESSWLEFWRTPVESRPLVASPPTFDPSDNSGEGDARADTWLLAAAVERPGLFDPRTGDPARVVVVGANTWFTDNVSAPVVNVDGRLAPRHPGNAELFEASVLWLAGRDDAIARSAAASSVPLIRPLDTGYVTGLRWGVILGLPMLVLITGVVWRTIRG